MANKAILLGMMGALIAAVIALSAWHQAREAVEEARARLITSEPQPIAGMLKENQAIITDLQTDPFTEQGSASWSPISPRFAAMVCRSTWT